MESKRAIHSLLTFEQPLQERIRLLLRLEALLQQFRKTEIGRDSLDHHHAISVLIDIYSIIGRVDVKRELMGELEKQVAHLTRLTAESSADQPALQQSLRHQHKLLARLSDQVGSLGNQLKDNDFFNSVRQRKTLPGGACHFDLPIYHYWLSQAREKREELFMDWFEPLEIITEAIEHIMSQLRLSARPRLQLARQGYYEQSLDNSRTWQLLRIEIDAKSNYFPEISAGRQRFSVRFFEPGDFRERPRMTVRDIRFRLSCCAL